MTLYASNSLCGVYNQLASSPEPLLLEFADAVCNLATPNVYGFNQTLLVLAGEHTAVLAESGWSRRQVQEFVIHHARRTVADFKRAARLPGEITPDDETPGAMSCVVPKTCSSYVRAGGPAAGRPACRAGAIDGPGVLPSRSHEPQEERHVTHSL